jgi:uncharacterized protein (DUF2249 family)
MLATPAQEEIRMSLDTALSQTPLGVPSEHSAGQPAGPNAAVIATIGRHHAELAARLDTLTAAVLTAAAAGQYRPARDALHTWYRDELLPHAAAEERALYQPAADLDATRLLVRGMLAEHRSLVSLIDTLAAASDALGVATAAAATQAVFAVHLSKENDLLLPALDRAGLDLAAALDGMHEILGHAHAHAHAGNDEAAGCGCGCADDATDQPPAVLQIGTAPPAAAAVPGPVADSGASSDELDVRTLAHGARHEIIFAKLDALGAGQRLVIVNDHDPKPLRYQTSAMWPDRFEWTYLQAGPQVWRVAIARVG